MGAWPNNERPDATSWEPDGPIVARRDMTVTEAALRPPALSRPADALSISFDDVYRREGVAMVRLALLLIGSHELAEEIVQDALAQLYERWDHIDRSGAYLRTCVVNGCRRTHRRRRQDDLAAAAREPLAAARSDRPRTPSRPRSWST